MAVTSFFDLLGIGSPAALDHYLIARRPATLGRSSATNGDSSPPQLDLGFRLNV